MWQERWRRLYEIAEAARTHKGITKNSMKGLGGPSTEWFRKLKDMDEPPTPRMRPSLDDLDRMLGWEVGTSWSLLVDDRSGWSADVLADEFEALVYTNAALEPRIRTIQTMVGAALRAMPHDEATAAMAQIVHILKNPPTAQE